MPDDFNPEHRDGAPHNDEKLLSDGREGLGDAAAHGGTPDQRNLGGSFERTESIDDRRLGAEFSDPNASDRSRLARSFEDPNSADDAKLGKSFEETEGKGKPKKHLSDVVHAPKDTHVLKWVILGVLVVFGLIFLLGWLPDHNRKKEIEEKAKEKRDAKPMLEVLTLKRNGADAAGLVLPGTTAAFTEATVYARANGYLKTRYVDIGDHVRKGQILALIDSPDLDQQVDQAREQLRQAEMQLTQTRANLDLARVTWDRYRVLVAKGVFSRQDGDTQDVNYRAQQANVSSAERNVEAYRANLGRVIALQEYEKVRSPFDGVITARNVDVGALIQTSGAASTPAASSAAAGSNSGGSSQATGQSNTAGSSGSGLSSATPQNAGSQGGALFSVAQTQTLRILVSSPEGYVGDVAAGTQVEVHFQSFPQQTFYGKVTRNAGSVDQNTRTLLTEVDLDNHNGTLLPGMYAVVTFSQKHVVADMHGAGPLLIPGDSVVIRQDKPMVAVVSGGVVHLVPVIIGRDFGQSIEIVSGLKEGDMIVTDVTDDVQDNAKVDTKEAKSATPAVQPPQKGIEQNNAPPGGSTQYGNPAITDADMAGQQGKQEQGGKNNQGSKGKASGTQGASKP